MSSQVLSETRDALTARRVYGEPYEKNGLTVIPAATVRGGGGAGGGGGPEGKGEGGGFGLSAHPAGAWVIEDGVARWRPAVDVTRIALVGELTLLGIVAAWRSVAVARARRPLRLRPRAFRRVTPRPRRRRLPALLRRARPARARATRLRSALVARGRFAS
jgi:hypothetical protein